MSTESAAPAVPPLASIALLAGAALGYQVLLTRLFAIIQWHHLAFMVISLALLGTGASGTLLALLGERARHRFNLLYPVAALLFGLSAVGAFLLVQRLPFNALELGWNPAQLGYLLIQYLLLAIPFLCAATGIGLALVAFRAQRHRVYGWDLAGAGAGALGMILLLSILPPLGALLIAGLAGLLAAALTVTALPRAALLLLALALVVGFARQQPQPRLSDYKALSLTLQAAGAEEIARRHSPLGLISVVRNETIPIRHAPGLSLGATAGPPEQLGLFIDGEPAGAITYYTGERAPLAFLDQLGSALPYRLLERPAVLVLGAGGGLAVLQALYHDARRVDAVELNRQLVRLLREDYAEFAGRLYERPEVTVHIADPRHFAATGTSRHDLIQLSLEQAGTGGLRALEESHRYTVEAFRDYHARLNPGGLLAVTGTLESPPRSAPRLFATAVAALEQAGIAEPGRRLVLIRGWRSFTLLLRNGEFGPQDIAAIREFTEARSFDLAYYPDMPAELANRYNRLPEPYLHQAALALLGSERERFLDEYKFDLRPATDDRPYFHHYFRWRTLPELWSLQAGGGISQLEWAYLVLVATLLQALLLGLLLILLPLWLIRGERSPDAAPRWRVLGYFTALGLGFLLLEIAFIQKLVLFLGHPLYAIAVVLAAFLGWAGLGSLCAGRLQHRRAALPIAASAVAVLAVAYLLLLPALFELAAGWPTPGRLLLGVLLIGPLAFCMGLPFPLGLARLAPARIPWAWAINGCTSVVAAVLALLLALAIGFSGVVLVAAGLYLMAGLVAPRKPV